MHQIDIEKANQFTIKVVQLKHEAGVLGLYKTMHALEAGVTAVGWEIAEHIKEQ